MSGFISRKTYRDKIKNSRSEVSLDGIALSETLKYHLRKEWVWVISIWSIIIISLLIISVIFLVIFEIRSIIINTHINNANDLKNLTDAVKNVAGMWHVYLISLVSLTSLLSLFIYLNRNTWIDKKDNEKDDVVMPQIVSNSIEAVQKTLEGVNKAIETLNSTIEKFKP